jgi:hypothetical protein
MKTDLGKEYLSFSGAKAVIGRQRSKRQQLVIELANRMRLEKGGLLSANPANTRDATRIAASISPTKLRD